MYTIDLKIEVVLEMRKRGSIDVAWFQINFTTEKDKLLTIRNGEPDKLLMLLIPGCLGNASQPQKLLDSFSFEPWYKTVAYIKNSVTAQFYRKLENKLSKK